MNNLIDKQAVMDAMWRLYYEDIDRFGVEIAETFDAERACEAIEAIPVSQSEIIRCKDCKHYEFSDNRAFGFPVKRCEWTGFEDIDDDDFCSCAERRTDE